MLFVGGLNFLVGWEEDWSDNFSLVVVIQEAMVELAYEIKVTGATCRYCSHNIAARVRR